MDQDLPETESKEYVATKKKKSNPGKNRKGQGKRCKTHHVGKITTEYKKVAVKRYQSLYKRKDTLIKKAKQISSITNSEVFVEVKTPTQQHFHWGTPYFNQKYGKTNTDDTPPSPKPSTSSSPAPFPSPGIVTLSNKNMEQQTNKSMFHVEDPNRCPYCGIVNGTDDDTNQGPWAGCDVDNCQFWCHYKCIHLKVTDKDLKKLKKIPFRCTKHMD